MMNKKWFSLVELIVAMSLVAILATISVISLTGYFEWVRDANRITQVNNIADGVALKLKDGAFLKPEWAIEIQHNSRKVSYQWYFGKTLLDKIDFSMDWTDPKFDTFFTYIISADWKYFQLMTFLEDKDSLEWIWYSWTIIENAEGMVPYIVWSKEIWVFLDDEIIPIHEYKTSPMNIETTSTEIFNVILQNDKIVSGAWDGLFTNIDNVVKNFGDNVYSCASQIYSYADYIVWTPTTSNSAWQNLSSWSACYFSCKMGFSFNWTNCEPAVTTQTVACIWKPANSTWNTTTTIEQTWNTSVSAFLPINQWAYNTTSSLSECRFKCDLWYNWNSTLGECTIPTRVFTCDIKPLNSSWNTAATINQTFNWVSWVPDETSFYSLAEVTDQCAYDCDTNYVWDSINSQCDAWTQNVLCTTKPDNSSWNISSTVNQVWNWSNWIPSNTSEFNTVSWDCKFTCDTNYTWNAGGNTCDADTRMYACTWLPLNAQWTTVWWEISQTWDWSTTSWLPIWTESFNETVSTTSCNFKCNDTYAWNWTSCDFSPIDDFKDTLVANCAVTTTDFDTNFDTLTGVYNWNINCSLRWLNDADLDKFTPLTQVNGYLDLESNSFTHLDWLNSLHTVTWNLKLNWNNIVNTSGLALLSDANTVYLQNNNINNTNGLGNNTTITYLDISWNNISNLSNIGSLTTLTELYVNDNSINDISAMSSLSNLDIVNLNNNSISNISWLSTLTWISELYLASNNISDLSPLSGLSTDILHIYWNASIDDLSTFSSYTLNSKTIALDDRAYWSKISALSSVCSSWTIRDQTLNVMWSLSNVCLDPAWSTTGLNWSYWDWYVDWGSNWNGNHGWEFDDDRTGSVETWPNWMYEWTAYLFVETSYNWWGYSNKTSRLSYDIVDSSNYVNFYYHAYWSAMWTMRVRAYDWSSYSTIYTISGQQQGGYGSAWIKTPDITIPAWTQKIQLFYRGTNWYKWDFAIDLIEVWEK